MNGIRIKINDVNCGNSFEMVKLVVKIISITKGLSLSETELHALSYFVINGYSKVSREALVTTKLLKNKQTEANLMNAFRKYGVLVKKSYGESLHDDFNISFNDIDVAKIELLIKK